MKDIARSARFLGLPYAQPAKFPVSTVAPWIVVDGEPFWGADRLPQIERWLSNQGF